MQKPDWDSGGEDVNQDVDAVGDVGARVGQV